MKKITIAKSATADSRSCDVSKVTKQQLLRSSVQHISDVNRAMQLIGQLLIDAATSHDADKLVKIDSFYDNFTSNFKQHEWLDQHYAGTRHHLTSRVPADVTLVDVIECICDGVMAGLARTGKVYPFTISPDILKAAVENTAKLLQDNVTVIE